MKAFRKGLLGAALAIPVAAHAIVIDNGIPQGQVGHFSADVRSGGATSSVITTVLLPTGEVSTRGLVFEYRVYVDVITDANGFAGGGALLSGGASALDENEFGGVTSTGEFPSSGGEAVDWQATSFIRPGQQQLETQYRFTAACAGGGSCGSPRIGDLRVFQYLDADISNNDVLRVLNDGTPSVRLETIDQSPERRFGASLIGAVFSSFSIAGGAADRYNLIQSRIVGEGQAVAGPNPGIIIENLGDGFEHPDLGFVYGPQDIVSVLAWDADRIATQAILGTTLAVVPPAAPMDTDGDGVVDFQDNCPAVFNPAQADSNGDGVGDACSPPTPTPTPTPTPLPPTDSDFDGVIDPLDLCPNTDVTSIEEDGGSIDPSGCPVPPIVNAASVPCSNSFCRVRVECPAESPAACTNTATIAVKKSLLQAKPVRPAARLGSGRVTMAAGVASIPPGAIGTIRMRPTKRGKQVLRANSGTQIKGVMTIRNSAGIELSATRIKMRIN